MIGSYKTNIVFGLFGLLLYGLFSFSLRFPLQSLLNAFITFIVFYLFAYLIRWLLGIALTENNNKDKNETVEIGMKNNSISPEQNHNEKEIVNEEQITSVSNYVKDLMRED
ncbi:hypothetical protein [Bacillus sp. JJ722]|uniref:hypothetical protein n=1 Tax=Bacillus sp. JJ722 TaxID=3122973 RepID=UPI00300057CC